MMISVDFWKSMYGYDMYSQTRDEMSKRYNQEADDVQYVSKL